MMHSSMSNLLQFFTHEHLPPHLAAVSRPFCELAHTVANDLEGAEATACLRKLLEAKDCAVRAQLSAGAEVQTNSAEVKGKRDRRAAAKGKP